MTKITRDLEVQVAPGQNETKEVFTIFLIIQYARKLQPQTTLQCNYHFKFNVIQMVYSTIMHFYFQVIQFKPSILSYSATKAHYIHVFQLIKTPT